jgi:hypothetical protein
MAATGNMMMDGRGLAQTLHFWLRIQHQNWEDGFPPSAQEAHWIRCAMATARQGGSLGRMQECILHAILNDCDPPAGPRDYSLDAFRHDLWTFQARYIDPPPANQSRRQ